MYDIRQFRPVLYSLLLLGFSGYALAAETPGLWVLAVALTLLNVYLFKRGVFRPLPRYIANAVTVLFACWMVARVRAAPNAPIFAIGEFLTFLQLVKMYEQRGNRDVAQLLVLSLLLMVAAAISTGSLLFGLLFIAYLFLSLYCCLLFHLKAESDHARQVTGLDESKINPMTERQDQRFLSRSMRRLTMVVSSFAIVSALLVFLLFPRGSGAGLIGKDIFRSSQAMTGFNDQVSFQDVARITQNDSQVAWVTVQKNGQPWGQTGETIYLRGSAPDTYVSNPEDHDRWQWKRTIGVQSAEPLDQPPNDGQDHYQQDIRLLPTGSRTLFAMPGLQSFRSARELKPTQGAGDDVLLIGDPPGNETSYTVVSTNANAIPYRDVGRRGGLGSFVYGDPVPHWYPVPEGVRDFAVRDDVAGVDAKGNLAVQRMEINEITELDEIIAKNFETYLRTNFKYTLDLTDAGLVREKDPLVQFLTDFKRGHCEYFAGAMALMCQSVGIKARLVVGFKCDEFNTMGGYFVVRQSHAHAWVEALTANGWQRFDPTSSNEAASASQKNTLWQRVRAALNFLEYKWGNAVVNYDSESQTNILTNTENQLSTTSGNAIGWMQDTKDNVGRWLQRLTGLSDDKDETVFGATTFYFVLMWLIGTSVVVVTLGLLLFIFMRLRLYRRARRIGLDALPNTDQLRLARQLAFYDQLLRALERRKIVRGTHMTPREFGASVGFLPAEAYAIVQGLTRIFYRVRYGEAELQPSQQKRLAKSVERIDAILEA